MVEIERQYFAEEMKNQRKKCGLPISLESGKQRKLREYVHSVSSYFSLIFIVRVLCSKRL